MLYDPWLLEHRPLLHVVLQCYLKGGSTVPVVKGIVILPWECPRTLKRGYHLVPAPRIGCVPGFAPPGHFRRNSPFSRRSSPFPSLIAPTEISQWSEMILVINCNVKGRLRLSRRSHHGSGELWAPLQKCWMHGGRWRERKWATCSCDIGFDLHPSLLATDSIHSKLECLWDTNAFSLLSSSSQWPLGVTSTYKLGRIEMQISFFSIWEQVNAGKCSSQTASFVCDFPVFATLRLWAQTGNMTIEEINVRSHLPPKGAGLSRREETRCAAGSPPRRNRAAPQRLSFGNWIAIIIKLSPRN